MLALCNVYDPINFTGGGAWNQSLRKIPSGM